MSSIPPIPWFKRAVLYQIYPRSFYDSNDDGIGDLKGITQKLDYLKGGPDSLGVSAIWLSPFYPSPMADFGYDVSDYREVDPIFGTLGDFKELLHQAHTRNLKVVIDFIPNHTSNQHDWFRQSRASKGNPKRNWYVWRDGKAADTPPNNWQATFGGSAWQFDPTTNQYYLHSFLPEQPDLNWDNPEVRAATCNEMRFWLDLGVDGFRVDAVPWISKDPQLRDNPLRANYHPGTDDPAHAHQPIYSQNGPKLYEYLHDMAETVRAYPDTFMITEAYPNEWDSAKAYLQFYRQVDPRVCAPFNFEGILSPWDAAEFKQLIDSFEASLKPNYLSIYCLGNHDRSRLASRLGSAAAARTAAVMLLTLPGMPTMYYGEELGMVDGSIPANRIQDPFEKNVPGMGLGRDPERTPLQWSAAANAGFSNSQPWLPVNSDYRTKNVQAQLAEPSSSLNLYRQLLALRGSSSAIAAGKYIALETPVNIFGYQRKNADETVTILLNFSDKPIALTPELAKGKRLLSTHPEHGATAAQLRPHEGIILKVS